MSRIGRKPISLPSGVTLTVNPDTIVVKGPKGEIIQPAVKGVSVAIEDTTITVSRANDEKQSRANHGLMRALLANHIEGVSQGYKKILKLVGTGYRVAMKGQGISLAVGYSHSVEYVAPAGVKLSIEGQDTITIEGIDKHDVGQVAANIRKIRPPEPYKGKGIRYVDEVVRRKQGKAAAK